MDNKTRLVTDRAGRQTRKKNTGKVQKVPADSTRTGSADGGSTKTKLQIRVPISVEQEWRAAAQAEGVSLNQFLENAIKQRRFVFEQATAVGNLLSIDTFLEAAIKRHRYIEEEKHKGASFYRRTPQDEPDVLIFEP
jgi:hypothetical protein